nr:hypothetical protein CKG001_00810 [Bdellovibrio sp. CKG001]
MDKKMRVISFVVIAAVATACSRSNNSGALTLKSASALTESEAKPSDLTLDQYNSITITKEPSKVELNGVLQDGTANNIAIVGTEVVLDADEQPFKIYKSTMTSDPKYVNSVYTLKVDAKRIIVRNKLHLPHTSITLNAEQIVFEDNGAISTTPEDLGPVLEPLNKRTKGIDGNEGYKGSRIQIVANEIITHGDKSMKRLIAEGGKGQDAGGGRSGTDGVSIPAFESIIETGISYGVVYREALHESPTCNPEIVRTKEEVLRRAGGKNCVGGQRTPARGAQQWPSDGGDAVPGGHPGAGGQGGTVIVVANMINGERVTGSALDTIASVAPGKSGKAAGVYKGGKAGSPQYAAMWAVQDNFTVNPRYVLIKNKATQNGKDAVSPTSPLKAASFGTATAESLPRLTHSEEFYKSRLKLIRDRYIAKNFTFVKKVLEEDLSSMRGLSKEYSSHYLEVGARYALLLNRINLQQDYFGRSYKEAPLYTLDFGLTQLDSEIDMALTNYYLTAKILDLLDKKQLSRNHLAVLVQQQNKIINAESDKQNIRISSINELEGMRISLKNNEAAYDRLLLSLNKQIEEQAKNNVARKHQWDSLRQNIKVLASLSKVIPAGQPTLAAAGTVMDYLADVPTSGSVADYIAYGAKAKADWEKAFSKENLTKSRSSFDALLNKMKISNLEDKSFQEKIDYLNKLKEEVTPVFEKMTEISKGFTGAVVPEDELQQEIERIKNSDQFFKASAADLERIVKQRAEVYHKLQETLQDIANSSALIEQSIALSLVAQDKYLALANLGDSTLRNLVQSIQDTSTERLLYVYNEVIKAYEYTTLEPLPQSSHFELLKEKTIELASASESLEESVRLMKSFYMSFIHKIVLSLDNKFHSASPTMLVRKDAVYVELNEKQILDLNTFGSTKIHLNKEFFGGHQKNLRIADIELEQTRFDESLSGTGSVQKTFLEVSHGGAGTLEGADGSIHNFTYRTTNRLHTWGSSYQFIGSDMISSRLIRDESVKGILGLLLRDRTNVLLYSPIFSQPAALATFDLVKRDQGGSFPLKSLRIKLVYTFF